MISCEFSISETNPNETKMSTLLDGLNPKQREAVTHETGPLLIIAGPGSGKTRTVVHSIAYAIENGVQPDRILAFSFTRKACEELKHRVQEIVEQDQAANVWISTFHSFCGKVLHQDIQQLDIGDRQEFTVNELTHLYNEGPRAQIEYLQHHQFAEPEDVLRFINECRAADVSPTEVGSYAQHRHMSQAYVEIYQRYTQLAENDEANYTECQLLTNALFRDVPEVKTKWQDKFDLIFVDEYQDTDPVQYQIIKALAGKHPNLRVVGDDDQGIYGWRGADIQNILNFENDYRRAKVISLGQNYRSTQRIVETSRALAEFNPDRRDKELFTRNLEGEKVKHLHCEDNEKEAETIADFISRAIEEGRDPNDFAVLYRTKDQAKPFKTAFNESEIPFSDRDAHGVSLMTIHKSKGLEFPNVFVAGLCKDLLPHYHNRDETDWDEELRLLYVAMTRAKNWLCLSSYEEDAQYTRGKSPFLDYIPATLLESVETLESVHIPPNPPEMTVPVTTGETAEYVEPLPERLLGNGMTVIGVDPGNIGARTTNVGWSITEKSSQGYSVLDFGTERPTGTREDKIRQIERKIKALIQFPSNRPHAIAVEKLEVATAEARKEWFLYVAGCVATIRSIADKEGIECRLYTPQQVKRTVTNNGNASKEEVQNGVKRMCNLQQIPKPHHSADAIAASLCYLRSYLNSDRYEGDKRKLERYKAGCDYLSNGQYEAAVDAFQETINIDPIYTEAHCGLGRAHLTQGDLEAAENAAKKSLKLSENSHPDSQKLLDAIDCYHSGRDALNNHEWNEAIAKFQESIDREPTFTEAHYSLGCAYYQSEALESAEQSANDTLALNSNHQLARALLDKIKKAYVDKGYNALERLALTEAEAYTNQAFNIDENYQPAQRLLDLITCYRRGCDHLNNQRYNEAIAAFNEVINRDSSFIDAHCQIGRAYLEQGNLRAARESAKAARNLNGNYGSARTLWEDTRQAHIKHGRAAFERGELDIAENIASDAQGFYKNWPPVRALLNDIRNQRDYNRGMTSLENEQFNEAIAAFNEVINRDSSFIDAHCGLSRAYLGRRDLDAARRSANAALRIDENCRSAQTLLANLENIRNQRDYERGMASLENEQFNEAIAAFNEVINRDSSFIDAHCGLSRAYLGRRDLDAARRSANAALRIDENCRHARELLQDIRFCELEENFRENNRSGEGNNTRRRGNNRSGEGNNTRRRGNNRSGEGNNTRRKGNNRSSEGNNTRHRENNRRSEGRNSGPFQRLWRAIRNRVRHH